MEKWKKLKVIEEEPSSVEDSVEDRVEYLEEVVDWLVTSLVKQSQLLEEWGIGCD